MTVLPGIASTERGAGLALGEPWGSGPLLYLPAAPAAPAGLLWSEGPEVTEGREASYPCARVAALEAELNNWALKPFPQFKSHPCRSQMDGHGHIGPRELCATA